MWKLDRLGRTLAGVLETFEYIDRRGIDFVSITERFDTSTTLVVAKRNAERFQLACQDNGARLNGGLIDG